MKNIHVLPTDKPSRLVTFFTNKFHLCKEILPIQDEEQYQNIYITSDEEIKEGDCFIGIKVEEDSDDNSFVIVTPKNKQQYKGSGTFVWVKKIILTTDQDLIKDGVQSIPDEFLEWFVKNPSCEFVKVEVDLSKHNGQFQTKYGYKIIITKKEPKQETLEEAAERLYSNDEFYDEIYCDIGKFSREKWIEGAKWQQERSYSEQDMIEFAYKYIDERRDKEARALTPELLIKQFKNK